ncbi:MAG: amidohydrolase family protein, partial [Pseudomonadales bacterium]|nr:amidohydrolase family protein [Pseudomonadales bacterium]
MNTTNKNWNRRRFLSLAALTAIGAAGASASFSKPLLRNPCRDPALLDLGDDPWLRQVWQGIDPAQVWDCHVHLAGVGDSGKGLVVGEQLTSAWHPLLNIQRLFYINGSCSAAADGALDDNYVQRLATLLRNMPAGYKAMLFAFDWLRDENGAPLPARSTFYIPNDYARAVAASHPDVFEWVASIHPYQADAVEQLHAAAAQGARAVKWLPATQNIDPASPRCDAFFAALAQLKLPLITHAGEEKATVADGLEYLGNPLRLRRALDAGVRVIVAHCGSHGTDEDLDRPGTRQPSFALFGRLMDEPRWRGNLYGDISALTLRNHDSSIIGELLLREDWHYRLLNGSDYPLPGIVPIVSPGALARDGLLPKEAVPTLETLREYNPLLFDFALKRLLSWQGKSFPATVFETRSVFT